MSKINHGCTTLLLLLFSLYTNITGQNNLLQRTLNDSTFSWLSASSNNITIYYQEDSYAEQHRMMLLRSIEKSVHEVLSMLEEPASERILNVFYLNSRDEMKQAIGMPVTGFAAWGYNSIFLVVNPEWRSFEKHEFTHNVTMGRWGSPAPSSRWMIEGISIYVDGWCREYTVDEVAYTLLANEELPHLKELFENYADLGEIKTGFYAGSFIGFIREEFGLEKIRRIWLDGSDNMDLLLGSDSDKIEDSWKLYLNQKVNKDVQVDLDTINELGCG
jgi:hypothetical protein